MHYSYRIYGLTVRSDLALPGLYPLRPSSASPDLGVELQEAPGWAEHALRQSASAVRVRPQSVLPEDAVFSVSETQDPQNFVLRYGDGTRFIIDSTSTRLWGEAGPGLSHDDLCVYLYGPVMGFLLRKKGLSPLHASAVSIHERAIALVGEAGAGKSTTAAALALRRWPVLCEDVCAFDEIGMHFYVRPAYPRVLLWPDSTKLLFSSAEALPVVVQGWGKRFLALDGGAARFADSAARLAAIFFLDPRSSDPSVPRIEELSAQEAILQLVQDTYMNWLLDAAQRAAEFDVLARLVKQVACYRVIRSEDPAHLPRLIELIESQALRLIEPASYPAFSTVRNV